MFIVGPPTTSVHLDRKSWWTDYRNKVLLRRLPLVLVRVGLDFDVAADRIGVIFQVVGGLQDVFLLDILHAFDFHIHVFGRGRHLLRTLVLNHVAASAARTRLLDRLFDSAFRADRRRLGQVIKSRAACDADPLG